MVAEPVPLDVDAFPELAALAEEVRRTGTPRVLRREGVDVAVLMPPAKRDRPRTKRPSSKEARQLWEDAFGAWRDHLDDPEGFKQELLKAQSDSRAPVAM